MSTSQRTITGNRLRRFPLSLHQQSEQPAPAGKPSHGHGAPPHALAMDCAATRVTRLGLRRAAFERHRAPAGPAGCAAVRGGVATLSAGTWEDRRCELGYPVTGSRRPRRRPPPLAGLAREGGEHADGGAAAPDLLHILSAAPARRPRRSHGRRLGPCFNWRWSADGGKTWTQAPSTPYANTEIADLPAMTTYLFCVSVTIGKTQGKWSDDVSLLVIH